MGCAYSMMELPARHPIMPRALLPILALAEQSMSMPAIHRRWTTTDVRALTNEERAWPRYELIDEELLVTPAPGVVHQLAASELWSILDTYLEAEPIGVAVMSPSDLELKRGTITQPDVFVIPADTRIAADMLEWLDVKALLLAIEVLSPASLRTDRVKKRDFYLENGVEEYWIVDLDARVVERWRSTQETPELLRDRLEWAPRGREPLRIDVTAFFERVFEKVRMFAR
jgi:Uma2 family endonuclease